MIVVSAGGGRDGFPLLKTALQASRKVAPLFPHRMYAFTGPFMTQDHIAILQSFVSEAVTLRCFTSHLNCYLDQADLSISLGGYNTTMDILRARVRALVCPSPSVDQADEQRIRAAKLAERDILQQLPDQPTVAELSQAIVQQINQPKPNHNINLQGAQNSAQRLKQLLGISSSLSALPV